MSDIAIRVEGLSKRYQIGERLPYGTLRERLMQLVTAAGRWLGDRSNGGSPAEEEDTIWALEDVSFEVSQGEVLGIIGRNGAGKSTLLKILGRITEPTRGYADVYGRVGSLLEIGTGFHNELTGRENIYLNGAVLGMTRAEIVRKFDEIVDFAGVERFIETPVKRYSSGMKVRLGFAVAAHLEPEILLVDEVLAVGDFEFQRKCIGAMSDVARGGRTVLFVSHNMAAVEALCNRSLVIEGGRVAHHGATPAAVHHYQYGLREAVASFRDLTAHQGRATNLAPIMKQVRLRDSEGNPVASVRMGGPLIIEVAFELDQPLSPVLGVVIKTIVGAPVFGVDNRIMRTSFAKSNCRKGQIVCNLQDLPLMPGVYSMDLYFGDRSRSLDRIEAAIQFSVLEGDVFGTGKLPPRECGPIFWPATWELRGVN